MKIKSKQIEIILLTSIFLFITLQSYFQLLIDQPKSPPHTTYSFAYGHPGDYFEHLAFINSGMHGQLFYTSPYTEQKLPPVFINPLYFIAGWIFSPFTKNPIIVMFILRIFGLGSFLAIFTLLIRRLFPSVILRLTAVIVTICTTPFWTMSFVAGSFLTHSPIDWNDTFDVYRKFLIPPHHFLAICALMLFILVLTQHYRSFRLGIYTAILTTIIGFLHPYQLYLPIGIGVLYGIWEGIHNHNGKKCLVVIFSIIIPAALIYMYYSVMTAAIYPWIRTSTVSTLFSVASVTDYLPFILALGPTTLLSLLVLFPLLTNRANRLVVLLLLWAILPFLGFALFPNATEPFKSQQYIPFALLTVFGVDYLIKRYALFLTAIPILILGSIAYAIPPYVMAINIVAERQHINDFSGYIPNELLDSFSYLNTYSPPNSFVLAGEVLSNMIPAFTQNRVIIGENNSYQDYDSQVSQVKTFFYNYTLLDSESMRIFLSHHPISYIIFGIDSPAYNGDDKNEPFLKEIYKEGSVSIVKVNL